ncbi:LuxR C-terminal-related transcriptional regulator [Enterovibrio baiacu]|uniref:helix-turn-helix transcriptional regulator n=1 Tax=Enterovibrio baiacu TaxID=2491023 RepID=UPI003D11CC33
MDANKKTLLQLMDITQLCITSNSDNDNTHKVLDRLHDVIPFSSAMLSLDHRDAFTLTSSAQVLRKNTPLSWVEAYQHLEYWHVDPVLQRIQQVNQAVSWRDCEPLAQCDNFSKGYKKHLGRDGISIQVSGDSGLSIVSLALESEKKTIRFTPYLEYLAPHIHEMFGRTGSFNRQAKSAPKLTEREKEVLAWAKEGKSNWEIATILTLSERTVKFHLSHVFRKLNVVNRSQAVAKAISLGIIEL